MKYRAKHAAITLLIFLAACGKENGKTRTVACLPPSLSQSVIAFYPFSNGSLLDISGNNLHLVSIGAASADTDRAGNPQCAYKVNNKGTQKAYLSCANPALLNNLNGLSVSVWYMITDSQRYAGSYTSLVSRDTGRSCPDRRGQWSLGLFDCARTVFSMSNSVWDQMITPLTGSCEDEVRVRSNAWHHAVATYDKASMTMALYRDGVLQQVQSGTADCGSGIPSVLDIGDLMLGFRFTGKLDDVALFDKALTQQEVSSLYNTAPCCSTYSE